MEIKDVNNQTLQGFFNKTQAVNMATSSLGAGFANLLQQTTSTVVDNQTSVEVDDKRDVAEKTERPESTREDKAKTEKNKKTSSSHKEDKVASDRKKNMTEDTDATEVNASATAADVKAEVRPEEKMVSESGAEKPATVEGVQNAEETQMPNVSADVAENGKVASLENAKNTGDVMPVVDALDALGVDVILTDDSFALTDENIVLSDLLAQPEVTVLTPDGAVEKMSGQDLAQQINLSQKGESLTQISLPEIVEDLPVSSDVLSEAVKIANEKNAADNIYTDIDLALQAETLDEKIENGKAIKVSVNVQNEQEAVLDKKLVKEDIALRETMQKVSEGKESSEPLILKNAKTTLTQEVKPNTVQNQQNIAPQLGGAANVANGQAPVENIAVKTVEVAKIDGVSNSGATLGASVAGNDFAQMSKTETSARIGDNSFKDIYKGMSKEVVDQVKVNITKSAIKGVDKIDISLKPEDLGHIEVKMQISKDGKLQAHIISSRPETMEMLQKEMQSLERAFADAGFEMDEGGLTFSFNDRDQASQNEKEESTRLRHFIGEMLEGENTEEMANDNWNYSKGLNIRV